MRNQKPLPPATEFQHLLSLDKIEPHHLQTLTPQKQVQFRKLLADKLAAATGDERDAFIEKIGAILEPDNIWEYNHSRITQYIEHHIRQFSCMPSKAAIAEATGISRKTVHKHLQNFTTDPANGAQNHLYGIMKHVLLNKVLKCAIDGDMAAAKLYLHTMKEEATNITNGITINNQNNYLQINGTILTPETIKLLKPRQLLQIEEIIKRSQLPLNPPRKKK